MPNNVPSHLIDKYLNGDCSVGEEKIVVDWYNSFHHIDPISHLSEEQQEELKNTMLERIKARAFDGAIPPSEPKVIPLKKCYYTAASVAAVFLIVFSFFYLSLKPEPSSDAKVRTQVQESLVTFRNSFSSIHKRILPDNSVVWLQPGATVTYKSNFVSATREITLSGEAFFDVTKDRKRPFIIRSGGIITKVLGTSFNVKSNVNKTEVSVLTGKVLVSTASRSARPQSVYLLPKQKASFMSRENKLVKHNQGYTSEALNIWEKNTLSFDNVAVVDVVRTLNKEFKTNIILTDPQIGNYALIADFTDVNLPTILELLCKSLDIKLHRIRLVQMRIRPYKYLKTTSLPGTH